MDRFEQVDNSHFTMKAIIGDPDNKIVEIYCADCGQPIKARAFTKIGDQRELWQVRIWHGSRITEDLYKDVTLMTYAEGPKESWR